MTSISKEQLKSVLAQIENGNVVFICEKTSVYINNFESKVVCAGSRKRSTKECSGEDVRTFEKRPMKPSTESTTIEAEQPKVLGQKVDRLRALMETQVTGCMFCFCFGKPSSHYLGNCPMLIGKCKKCFKTADRNSHICVVRGSLPKSRKICFLCGLTNEHHASGTWGTSQCQTWASDKMLCMATIFWTFEEMFDKLKRKPPCGRRTEEGEMKYVDFYEWLFNFDGDNDWNYVSFLLDCFASMKI